MTAITKLLGTRGVDLPTGLSGHSHHKWDNCLSGSGAVPPWRPEHQWPRGACGRSRPAWPVFKTQYWKNKASVTINQLSTNLAIEE
jgi:hypothetical protein